MTTLLCAAPYCRKPGSHATDCKNTPDVPCRGCLPAVAADGLYLCTRDTGNLANNPVIAAGLWHDLGLCLIGAGGINEIRARAAQPGLSLNLAVVDARNTIRATLVGWTRVVAEERGIELPWTWRTITLPQGVHGPLRRLRTINHATAALGRFLQRHTRWLAAQPFAADVAGELHELVHAGRALLQTSNVGIVKIGPCPMSHPDGQCAGTLRAVLRPGAALLPSVVACDTEETHSWDSTQWSKLGRTMAKVRAAA